MLTQNTQKYQPNLYKNTKKTNLNLTRYIFFFYIVFYLCTQLYEFYNK